MLFVEMTSSGCARGKLPANLEADHAITASDNDDGCARHLVLLPAKLTLRASNRMHFWSQCRLFLGMLFERPHASQAA